MDWVSVSTGVAGIAVVVGIFVALLQLHSMRRASRREAYSSIIADLHDLGKILLTHPNVDQLLDEESPKGENNIKQQWLVLWYLDLYENIHYQNEKGIIPKELWLGWEKEIKQTCKRSGFKKQYECLKERYNRDFINYIEELLKTS